MSKGPNEENLKFLAEKALYHTVRADQSATHGVADVAKQILDTAKTWHGMHTNYLSMHGKHEESSQFKEAFGKIFKMIEEKIHARGKLKKSIEVDKENVAQVGQVKPTQSQMAQYKYVPFAHLSATDQIEANKKFNGVKMHEHNYPVDENHELVHGQRMPKLEQLQDPVRHQSTSTHKLGAPVEILQQGNAKRLFGIVTHDHPLYPGKVAVQYGPAAHHTVYIDHANVLPSYPSNAKELALFARGHIRKKTGI